MDCIFFIQKVHLGKVLSPIIHGKTHYWHLMDVHELLVWSKYKLNLVLTLSFYFIFSSCAYLG